ncbi:MAG: hypothetical protein ACP5IX_00970, partial [Patescibacteria group bacterium]
VYFLVIFPPKFGPSRSGLTDFSSLISRRFELGTEPAAVSRWQQLGPLWQAIKQRPLFGSGFGTIITYQSQDPRAIAKYGGRYSTYAFEWGYLDIVLKIGFMGLAVYLILIYQIFREGIKLIFNFQFSIFNFWPALVFGLLLGLIALVAAHISSPYLNHPLGIGYLMLCSAILSILSPNTNLPPAKGGQEVTK